MLTPLSPPPAPLLPFLLDTCLCERVSLKFLSVVTPPSAPVLWFLIAFFCPVLSFIGTHMSCYRRIHCTGLRVLCNFYLAGLVY